MKYMGSKNRIAKYILPIILKDRKENQYYIEPFVGGANMIDKVDGLRIANDINPYLISLLYNASCGKKYIEHISKELYSRARNEYNNKTNNDFNDFQLGWIGYMASANGRFFEGGYSGISKTKTCIERNYIQESIDNLNKQIPNLLGIEFYCKSYEGLNIPDNSIIYCDIPYKDTKQYSFSKDFNYDKFWNWAREKTKQGHKVYISEYNAPDDFECVWQQEVKSSLSANGISGGNKISTEKLFTYILTNKEDYSNEIDNQLKEDLEDYNKIIKSGIN